MRAMWKGHLRFNLVTIPIQIFKAEETADKISFNQLHKKDFGRVGYEKKCKKCHNILSNDEIVKGYEYDKDHYVVIDPDDLERLKVKSERTIEVQGFLNRGDISPARYLDTYFAGPDGAVAAKSYALFREALDKTGKVGVGRVTIGQRERVVAMTACDEGIVLYTVLDPAHLRDVEEVAGAAASAKVDKKELDLAERLIGTMEISHEDVDFADHYQDALSELVSAKVEGKEVVVAQEDEPEAVDLMTALQASIDKARPSREPVAKGAKRPASRRKKKASG
jgi:DNA end-binding protein Ku